LVALIASNSIRCSWVRSSFFIRLRARPETAQCNVTLRCLSVFSEKRPDVIFQDCFHAFFGFRKIAPSHQDGQVFTNALPTIIFRPKHALHINGSNQRYFYSARPHDLVLVKFLPPIQNP
jgi:hypothetical protein